MAMNKFMEHYQLYNKYFQDINHIRFINTTGRHECRGRATLCLLSLFFFVQSTRLLTCKTPINMPAYPIVQQMI